MEQGSRSSGLSYVESDLSASADKLLVGAAHPGRGDHSQFDNGASVRECLPFVDAYEDEVRWAAMGDPTRRAIIASLAERPHAVGELASELPVSRPAVSQALKVLKNAGLVSERAEGTRRIYRLNPIAVAALRDQLDTFWTRAMSNYTDLVADSTQEKT